MFPQISDDNFVVIQDPSTNGIVTYTFPGNVRSSVAGSAQGFSDTGIAPGISPESEVVSFSGIRGAGEGIFVSVRGSGGARTIFHLAGEGMDDVSDIELDHRVGVTCSGTLASGYQIAVVFRGVNDGVQGVHAIGATVKNDAGVLVLDAGPPVLILPEGVPAKFTLNDGTQVTKTANTSYLYDPINKVRQIAFTASFSDGTTGIVRVDPIPRHEVQPVAYENFEQFRLPWTGRCLAHPAVAVGHSSCTSRSFGWAGCLVSAFSTIVDKLAHDAGLESSLPPGFNPLSVAEFFRNRPNPLMSNEGDVDGGRMWYSSGTLLVYSQRAPDPSFYTFDEIASQALLGKPVLIAVPSRASTPDRTLDWHTKVKGVHYVVVTDYHQGLGMLYGAPAGLVIHDPAKATGTYTAAGEAGYIPGFVETDRNNGVKISLHD